MQVTSKLKVDLQNHSVSPRLQAMQEDTGTRSVELSLYSGGLPWQILEDATAAVSFRKPDGTAGLYDKLPDGTDAIALSENVVTLALVPQMLTVPGLVQVVVTLYDAGRNQLSTFPFHIQVEENPAAGQLVSQNYCYYTSIAQINEALQRALDTMADTVSTVETKLNSGAFQGKSAYEYAKEAGFTGSEEAFSQALSGGLGDLSEIDRIVQEYLEENPPVSGGRGENGATFVPSLDASGNLSWSNDHGLTNPDTVNIKGPKGDTGATGPAGEHGVSAYHSWNGTVLTVTTASGSSSADLKGEKGEAGLQGEKGDKGEKGDTGTAGYSPVRGTDYWTDADIAEIKAYVDDAILGGAW